MKKLALITSANLLSRNNKLKQVPTLVWEVGNLLLFTYFNLQISNLEKNILETMLKKILQSTGGQWVATYLRPTMQVILR